MRVLVAGFQAGEFSPLLEGRTDLAQAANGCRLMRNAIPRALGGAFQRPGFIYAGMQRAQQFKTRLIPFAFSSTVTYRIELGHGFARFWIGNRLCIHQPGVSTPNHLSVPGEILVVATPWLSDVVDRVQFAQANDVIWLTYDGNWPQTIIRYGEEDWQLAAMELPSPPLRDPNASATTIAASGTTGAVSLTASAAVFDPLDIGGFYEIAHRRTGPFIDFEITHTYLGGNYTSAPMTCGGKWEMFTYGSWSGVLYLEIERYPGTWENLRTWMSRHDFNAQSNGEVEPGSQLRLRIAAGGAILSGAGFAPRANLADLDSVQRGLVRITAVSSSTSATATVYKALSATTATNVWSEGAWSNRRGYPRTVTMHGQRLIFAGTRAQPQTLWGSSVNAFGDFARTTLADSGFAYQIAAQQSNPICWVVSQKGLLIGTEGDEWVMDGGSNGEALTASSVRAERRSGFGSANVQAQLIGSAVMFVQAGSRILNEYVFDFAQQGYEAIELTELAEHLGDERFVQFAYAPNPYSIVWAVTEEGSLISLTYKRRSQVLAWAKHTTPDGIFESVCTTPGPAGITEVWVTVCRTIDGVHIRTVERMDPDYWRKLKAGETRELVVGDGAVIKTGAAFTTVTGLEHLEGAIVQILADGAIHPERRVLAGEITLEREVTAAVVGLAPLLEIQPMPVEIQMDSGSSFGRRFRVPDFDVKLWQTGGSPTYADEVEGKSFDVPMRSSNNPTGAPVPLFTGILKLPNPARHKETTQLILRNETMLPLNILSMVMQVEVHGP